MKETDELKTMLSAWQPNVELPMDFNSQVWTKIAAREEERMSRWWNRCWQLFLSPQWTASLAAIVLLIAVTVGQIQSRARTVEKWHDLRGKYVTSIDPYASSLLER